MELCRTTYQTGINFLKVFNPGNQHIYTSDIQRCYMGTAPSLVTVSMTFGAHISETWLETQLIDLSEYSGKRQKMSAQQAEATARVIISEFGYLKVTELMHFFQMFKGGKYGHFYEAVDPMIVTEAIHKYLPDRYDLITKFEKEQKKEQEAAAKAEHDKQVAKHRAFLNEYHLTPIEFARLTYVEGEPPLTSDEFREIGWLLRMGYENIQPSSMQSCCSFLSANIPNNPKP